MLDPQKSFLSQKAVQLPWYLRSTSTKLSLKLTLNGNTMFRELGAHANQISLMISAIVSLRGLSILQPVYCHNSNTPTAISAKPTCTETVCQKGLFSVSKFAQFHHVELVKTTKSLVLTAQTFCSKTAVLAKLYSVVQV